MVKFTEKELEKFKKLKMEEIDRWLDNEYGVSYTRLEELHDFVIEQDMKHQDEKDKEIERLNKRIITLEETIRRANNNVLKDIAMIKTHEMIKQEIVQRLFETSKMLEKGSD